MPDSILSTAEQTLLRELESSGVRYIVVGMSAALLQGARGATEDVDLWFENVDDPRIADAVRIGGEALGDRFDVVAHMSGLSDFATEYAGIRHETVDGIVIPVLPLERILASKKAANRPKDRGNISALEDTLLVLAETAKKAH
jgi:predicted nucleotidyltransferase